MRVLGIDLGGTNTKLVVLGEDCEPIERREFKSGADGGPQAWAARLADQLGALVGDEPVDAVGVSVAALVDEHSHIVQAPNLNSFVGVDVAGLVHQWRGDLKVRVENDVNAAIVAEHRCGAGRGCAHLCMLSLGTGVGGGVILDDRLYRGAHGLAGELGHMVLDHDGPPCACGRPGHVESYLSTAAIIARAHERLGEAGAASGALAAAVARGEAPEPKVLAACALQGCSLSSDILAECGTWLGIACTNLAHALQPDRILIGGGVSQSGELLLGPAREEYRRRLMSAVEGTVPIEVAALGVDGAAIGAALLARDGLGNG